MDGEPTTMTETSATPPAAAATASPTPTPAAPPAAEPTINVVPLKLEEYNQMRARLDELDRRVAEEQRKAAEANDRAIQRQIENGEVTKALEGIKKTHEEALARTRQELESAAAIRHEQALSEQKRLAAEKAAKEEELRVVRKRAERYALDRDLAQALAPHDLVPGGAQQLARLWADQITVQPEGDTFATRSISGQSVQEFVATQLASDEYKHFVRASVTRGGVLGAASSAVTSPQQVTTPPAPPQFGNLGAAALAQVAARRAPAADGATNMAVGIGLRAPAR